MVRGCFVFQPVHALSVSPVATEQLFPQHARRSACTRSSVRCAGVDDLRKGGGRVRPHTGCRTNLVCLLSSSSFHVPASRGARPRGPCPSPAEGESEAACKRRVGMATRQRGRGFRVEAQGGPLCGRVRGPDSLEAPSRPQWPRIACRGRTTRWLRTRRASEQLMRRRSLRMLMVIILNLGASASIFS